MATLAQRARRKKAREDNHASRWPHLIKSAASQDVDATLDFADVLSKRAGRKPGRLYKRGDDTAYLDIVDSLTDKGAMSATFTICTPRPDREDDVILPEGVRFDDYRLNPLVMWDHGFSDLTLPVGSSEGPDGNLAVVVTPERIDATCYFSQSLLEAEQLFQLVDEGTLRAASIHVDPIDAVVRARRGPDERPGLLVNSSNMIEWSICAVGCNPDAVRKALNSGRAAGKPLAHSLIKSLSPFAAATSVVVRGHTSEETVMAKSLRKSDDADEFEKRRKALEDDDDMKQCRKDFADGDDETKRKALGKMKSLIKDAGLSEEDMDLPQEPGETKSDDTADIEDGDTPLGAQILAAAHSALADVADQIEAAAKPLENPQVKEYTANLTNALHGHADEIKDLHKSEYPDQPELDKADDEDAGDNADDTPPEASGMAKFLARAKTDRMSVRGISAQLLKLAERQKMPKQYRAQIASLSRSLASLVKKAEKASVTALADDEAKEFAKLKTEFSELKALLKEAMPANRR